MTRDGMTRVTLSSPTGLHGNHLLRTFITKIEACGEKHENDISSQTHNEAGNCIKKDYMGW